VAEGEEEGRRAWISAVLGGGAREIGGPKEAWMDGNRWGVKDIH
jgi:hypothetical protein